MNIIEKITNSFPDLTKSEQVIANYILKNPKAIELYTITKIAELTKVSKSGVLRFCQKLDYQGYSEFRYDMINYLHAQSQPAVEQVSSFNQTLALFSQSIRQLKEFDPLILETLVDQIIDAQQVYCLGIHKSGVLAQKFAYNFINQGQEVFLLKDMVEIGHLPFHIKENSLIIIFSISGASSQLNEFLKSNQDLKERTYLFTSSSRSSTAKLVKDTIIVPTNSLIEGMVDPHAIHMIIIEILTQIFINKSRA